MAKMSKIAKINKFMAQKIQMEIKKDRLEQQRQNTNDPIVRRSILKSISETLDQHFAICDQLAKLTVKK
jgi:Tfp pilus assembly protein PilN